MVTYDVVSVRVIAREIGVGGRVEMRRGNRLLEKSLQADRRASRGHRSMASYWAYSYPTEAKLNIFDKKLTP